MTETTARSIPLQIVQGDSPSAAPLQAGVKQLGGDKINRSPVQFADAPVLRKPSWIRVRIPSGNAVQNLKAKLRENRLVTVCEEASCPNIHECFGHGTATFMILGEVCTRRCSFCDVAHGRPKPPDANEPASLGQTVADMGLKYVVVTSVDRDDLRDGGAQHFVDCISAIRAKSPGTRIEVLTPDFRGKGRMERALEILAQNPPDVFNHNIETVPDLYRNVRPGADYQWSLNLLKNFKAQHPDVPTKSGIMLGLGEEFEQIKATMRDLRAHDVDMITIGQYLQPTAHHHPVLKYWTPEDYKALEDYGYELGFSHVASGPMVRSSYHADVQAKAHASAEERVLDALVGSTASPATRDSFRKKLRDGQLDDKEIEIEIADSGSGMPGFEIPGMPGANIGVLNLSDMFGKAMGGRTKRVKTTVRESYKELIRDESDKLIDNEAISREAVRSVENDGIVFLDEIDKIAARDGGMGAGVSREGVQRDLLPLVEGTTVSTKYGPVKTDHILFIASGAFHVSKPSDLLPELQGRLPIRVELKPLTKEDFRRILTETEASLIRQYIALMGTEDLTLEFTEDAIDALADVAVHLNSSVENIGARRLQTVMERVLDEISFAAPDKGGQSVTIDEAYVREHVGDLARNTDLFRFIL